MYKQRQEFEFICADYKLALGSATKIMGILNVGSNSFSQDAIYKDPQRARDLALKMVEEGADIIDIGGESTRPGAQTITQEEEIKRVLPVVKLLRKEINLPISVDTTKAAVASAALESGASIINDISGLKLDPQMASVIANFGAGCVLMHIKGTPETMQQNPTYTCLTFEIITSLKESIDWATKAGIDRRNIIIDPGIGFGKTVEHNLQIIKLLDVFASLGLPILIGTSRKAFIGYVLKAPVKNRLFGTAATTVISILNGAHIIRVHDVAEIAQLTKMTDAILSS